MRTQRFIFPTAVLLVLLLSFPGANGQTNSPEPQRPLIELVRQMDPSRSATDRLQAAEAVAGYGEHAVPYLLTMLDHQDRKARLIACLALSRIGPKATAAVSRLTEAIDDEDAFVRAEAAYALGRIGPPASDAAARLATLFDNADASLRQSAITAVGQMGRDAATPILSALRRDNRQVRLAACTALQEMQGEGGFAVPELVDLCGEADAELQDAVFLTLASVGREAIEPLMQLLHQPDEGRRRRAAMALGRIGPPAADAVPELRRALQDSVPDVRFWAAKALGEIGPDAAASIDDLVAACSDEDPDVRWQAAVSLELIGDHAKADRAWSELCDDPHAAVRHWAETRLAEHQ